MRPGIVLFAIVLLLSAGCTTGVAQSSVAPEPYTGPSIADVIAANATPLPTRIPSSPMNIGAEPAPAATVEAPTAGLRGLALQPGDFPAGFQQVRELSLSNADVANLTSDPVKVFDLFESTGRVSGFATISTKLSIDGTGAFPVVTVSINRYRDGAEMATAWSGFEAVSLQYPPFPYLKTEQLDPPRLGDQSGAMRLSMKDASGQTMVLHWTYFRHGPIIADVTTAAGEAQSDKGELSAALAKKLFDRVSARPR